MRYDDFKLAWTRALTDSDLRTMTGSSESLDLNRLCRHYEVSVEPIGGQDVEPFFVTGVVIGLAPRDLRGGGAAARRRSSASTPSSPPATSAPTDYVVARNAATSSK